MSAAPLPVADQAGRDRAATDLGSNLVVIAGAGTGKTSLLIERALTAIAGGHIRIEQLAAITFTEKATAEMKTRLAGSLEELWTIAGGGTPSAGGDVRVARSVFHRLADRPGFDAQEVADRVQEALHHLDRVAVRNIHGLCADLLRAFPRASGVDPGFSVDPGEAYAALLDEQWPRFLAAELGEEAPRSDLWARLLARVDLNTVATVGRDLARFAIPLALLTPRSAPPPPGELFRAEIDQLIADLDALLQRREEINPGRSTFATALEELGEGLTLLRDGGTAGLDTTLAAGGAVARRIGMKSAPRPSSKVASDVAGPARRTAAAAHELLRACATIDEDLTGDLLEAVAPFARHAREMALARGLVTFDALLHLTRDLLRDNPEVRDAIRSRYRLLLVDEFQDTDPVQYEIVLFLAEVDGGRSVDSYRAELAPGRLFIVGDPKQSIYRFRGADHAEFERATQRVLTAGGTALDLVANFRSVPGVIDAINALFTGPDTVWTAGPRQPPYVPLIGTRPAAEGDPPVEIWTVDPEAARNAASRRKAEGQIIAAEIAAAVAGPGGFAYGDFSIVFGALINLAAYLRPLRDLRIPFVIEGGHGFLQRPEVQAFRALLSALARPGDPIAFLAFLRSPAGAVTDVELAAYAAEHGTWTWQEARPDASRFPGLARARERLARLHDEIRSLPVDTAVHRILSRSDLLTLSAGTFEGAQGVANLRRLAGTAARLARDGGLSLHQVVETIDTGRAPELEGEASIEDEGRDAVQILTIHKAKGLENRVVIIPDLARQKPARRSDRRRAATLVRTSGHGQHVGVQIGRKSDHRVNAARLWLERENRRHEEAERVRLLYVALTRAADRAIVLAAGSRRPAPLIQALRAWGYDSAAPPDDGALLAGGCVRHRYVSPRRLSPAETGEPAAAVGAAVSAWNAAVSAAHRQSRRPLRSPSSLHDEASTPAGHHDSASRHQDGSREDRVQQATPDAGALGRCTGICVHRVLETWDGEANTLPMRLAQAARQAAARAGIDEAQVEQEARRVLSAFVTSPLAERFRQAHRVIRELPVLAPAADGSTWTGTIDLLLEDPDGNWFVIDHKTDRTSDPSTLRDRHGEQLSLYALAVAQALGLSEPPRAEIWHLRSGRAIPVDPTRARVALPPPPAPG
ncbi:MAG: UvrD-helicase domain-containing protein [Acidobacteriota bacterium]